VNTPDFARISPGFVDLALVATTSAYAAWLWTYRRRPQPHTTWIKVVVGDGMCIIASACRSYGAGLPYDLGHVVWAFVVGGTPIVIGELLQELERRRDLRRLEEDDGDAAPPGRE
jgi:hypothetical protein